MTTAVVSDLHLGTQLGNDVARRPEVRARLAEGLAAADRVVFLGDTIELREQPVEQVLEAVGPALADLADVLAGKPVTLVAGNHDHRLVEPLLDAERVEGGALALDWTVPAEATGIGRQMAARLPGSELTLAYPGVWVRDDVYALHGHYLDLHMTVPRLESILGGLFARSMLGRSNGGPTSADEYERALGPLYALAYALAQGLGGKANKGHTSISRVIWERANQDGGRGGPARLLLSRVAIPAGVAALNRAGLGPFSPELTGVELRRSGLRAMADVVRRLGIEANHVLFGHTHRPGPLQRDDPDDCWLMPEGTRLWNTGSWYREQVLSGTDDPDSPYWPGTLTYVRDSGPPELVNLIRDIRL